MTNELAPHLEDSRRRDGDERDARSSAVLRSVSQAGYDRFQQALLLGKIRPGQVVSQRELVDLLGLSIGALRELLPRLATEALLTVMPQRGIRIMAIDLPMIRDAFQMRMAFEREAVMTAVRRMPDDLLVEQRALHMTMVERVKIDPSPALFEASQRLDADFHNLLIASTENELLIQAYNVNSIRVRLIKLDRVRLSSVNLPSAFADHISVIDAILSRNIGDAITAMDAHMIHARENAMQL